jgi:hypothetical protein
MDRPSSEGKKNVLLMTEARIVNAMNAWYVRRAAIQ